jgi:hypothetical protein
MTKGVTGFFDARLDWAAKPSFFTFCHVRGRIKAIEYLVSAD